MYDVDVKAYEVVIRAKVYSLQNLSPDSTDANLFRDSVADGLQWATEHHIEMLGLKQADEVTVAFAPVTDAEAATARTLFNSNLEVN